MEHFMFADLVISVTLQAEPHSLAGVAPALPTSRTPAEVRAANNAWRHPPEWRPRSTQGWLNRWCHLSTLVLTNQFDRAREYVLQRENASRQARALRQRHQRMLEQFGQDPAFGIE